MSLKRKSGYISGTISTSLGIFVLDLGLVFKKKYINLPRDGLKKTLFLYTFCG